MKNVKPDEEMLHFVDEKNDPIVTAPMKNICENSHYFEVINHAF